MARLERLIAVLHGLVSIAILVGAVLIMIGMDRGSVSQGGRVYVAIAALFLLGAVATQARGLMARRQPFSLTATPQEHRYAFTSLLIMLACGAGLVGLALLLP